MINKNERLVSGQGAGVAEHGQSRTKHEKGLYARDSRSRLLGVREFKSHPLHHGKCQSDERRKEVEYEK